MIPPVMESAKKLSHFWALFIRITAATSSWTGNGHKKRTANSGVRRLLFSGL
jgi:hypothetical protein